MPHIRYREVNARVAENGLRQMALQTTTPAPCGRSLELFKKSRGTLSEPVRDPFDARDFLRTAERTAERYQKPPLNPGE